MQIAIKRNNKEAIDELEKYDVKIEDEEDRKEYTRTTQKNI